MYLFKNLLVLSVKKIVYLKNIYYLCARYMYSC